MSAEHGPAACEREVAELVERARALPAKWRRELLRRMLATMTPVEREARALDAIRSLP